MWGYLSSLTIVAGHESIGRQRQIASVVVEETDGLERTALIRRQLSEGEISELNFWEEKLVSGMIRDMEDKFEPQWFLVTDASADELSTVLRDGSGQTVMRMSELRGTGLKNESSALRELRAVQMAVERMTSRKRGAVLIHTDSQAAIVILRKGSMQRTRIWHPEPGNSDAQALVNEQGVLIPKITNPRGFKSAEVNHSPFIIDYYIL